MIDNMEAMVVPGRLDLTFFFGSTRGSGWHSYGYKIFIWRILYRNGPGDFAVDQNLVPERSVLRNLTFILQ